MVYFVAQLYGSIAQVKIRPVNTKSCLVKILKVTTTVPSFFRGVLSLRYPSYTGFKLWGWSFEPLESSPSAGQQTELVGLRYPSGRECTVRGPRTTGI